MKIKKYFLIFSSIAVSILALLYGASPQWFAKTCFGVSDLNINLAHILRAVMGLYLALGLYWLLSAYSDKYRNTAVLSVLVFAAGLFTGRIVSFIADGRPSPLLVLYFFIEVAYVPAAYWVFRRPE